MKQISPVKVLVTIIGWTLLLLLSVFIQDFNLISKHAPTFYYISLAFLVPIYYILDYQIKRRKTIILLGVLTALFTFYFFIPSLIVDALPKSELNIRLIDLHAALQAKVRLATLIQFLIVIGVAVLRHSIRLKNRAEKLESEQTKAELSLLKSQITPHFFFNSLNTIYYLTLQKSDDAPNIVVTLSDIMRYVLTEANAEEVTMAQEQQYLDKFITIQKLRLPEKTSLNINIDIEDRSKKIAPLLFIPFVENAFKFGLSANVETAIDILLESKANRISFRTENRLFNNDEKDGTGTGLDNIRKRLNILYPDKHTLKIESGKDKFIVELEIDLNE